MLEAESEMDVLLDSGRLAAVFCRLAQQKYTGLVYVEHEDCSTVFYLRDGAGLFVEGSVAGESIAETFLERGLISRDHYAEIVSRMTESLVDSEDMVFCQKAVELGVVSQDAVDTELRQRVRAKVVQSVGWEDCFVELEEDPELGADQASSGEPLPPLIYTAVRTFYFEEELERELGDLQGKYGRLRGGVVDAVRLLGLEHHEASFLGKLEPGNPLLPQFAALDTDELEAQQLVLMLCICDLMELGDGALDAEDSLSGVHSTVRPPVRDEEITAEVLRPQDLGARAPVSAPPERVQAKREPQPRPAHPSEEMSDEVAKRLQAYMNDEAPAQPAPRRQPQPAKRAPSASSYRAVVVPDDEPARPAARRPRRVAARGAEEPKSERSEPASSKPRRPRRERKLGAIARLGDELKQRRPDSGPKRKAAAQPTRKRPKSGPTDKAGRKTRSKVGAEPAAKGGAGSNALKSLMLNRRRAVNQALQDKKPEPAGAEQLFRNAKEMLRDNHFPRALELMQQACAADPENHEYVLYRLWSDFRASANPQSASAQELRKLCRERLSEEGDKGFLFYCLAHLALAQKNDDQAEKYFRKAHTADKGNRDAERYLRILERRREKGVQDPNKPAKVFGIELTLSLSKKDKDDDDDDDDD